MRRIISAIIYCVALFIIGITVLFSYYRPHVTLEINNSERFSGNIWRSLLTDRHIEAAKVRFHELPRSCSDVQEGDVYLAFGVTDTISKRLQRDIERLQAKGDFTFSGGYLYYIPMENPENQVYEIYTALSLKKFWRSAAFAAFLFAALHALFLRGTGKKQCISQKTSFFKNYHFYQKLAFAPVNQMDKSKQGNIDFFLFAVNMALLFTKIYQDYFFGSKYLLNEDLARYLHDAQNVNFSSILNFVGGNLAVAQYSGAIFASIFPFAWRPDIFLFVCLFYMAISLTILAKSMISLDATVPMCLLGFLTLAFQPQQGQMFFLSLVVVNFVIAPAYILYMTTLDDSTRLRRPFEIMLIITAGLSSVPPILSTPIIILKAILLKDLKKYWDAYALSILCFLLQSFLIFERASKPGNDYGIILPYLKMALSFNLYTHSWGSPLVVLFWTLLLLGLIYNIKEVNGSIVTRIRKRNIAIPLLWILLACLFIAAAVRHHMTVSYPSFSPNRYTYIPSLLFGLSAIVLCAKRRWLFLAEAVVILVICICGNPFRARSRPMSNFHFSSYANFAKHRQIFIPNPNGLYPWGMRTTEALTTTPSVEQKQLTLDFNILPENDEIAYENRIITPKKLPGRFNTETGCSSLVLFNQPIQSNTARDIGVEITLTRRVPESSKSSSRSFLALYWIGGAGVFRASQMQAIEVPYGEIKLFFAFPYSKDKLYLALRPGVPFDDVSIKEILYYELP